MPLGMAKTTWSRRKLRKFVGASRGLPQIEAELKLQSCRELIRRGTLGRHLMCEIAVVTLSMKKIREAVTGSGSMKRAELRRL